MHKFYREILTKLNTQQVEDIEMHLAIQFNQDTTPASVPAGLIAEWSRSCEAHDYHLGHFFVIGRQGIDLIFAALGLVYIA